ncbi:MAG: hypothetical protein ACUVTX_05480 [Bacteroidales bacterium]
MKLSEYLIIAGFLLFFLFSCRERNYKNISEGEVHYSIEYLKNQGSIAVEFKPRTLIVSFKNDKILFEILSPLGNQGIINIVNPEKGIYDTYVNMLGTRFYYSGSPDEMHPGFSSMNGVVLNKTSRTTVICGFTCHHAEAMFSAVPGKVYDIWYTDEIKVRSSNSSTPFSELNGVLMSFYYIMGGSEMKFEAEAVYKKKISEKIFERKPKYKLISKTDMDKIISDIVNL